MTRGDPAFHEDLKERSEKEWRVIAGWWHDGQSTPLYAFASTGTVLDGLAEEIESCLEIAAPDDVIDLEDLLDYVQVGRLNPLGWKVAHPNYRSEMRRWPKS